jgi:hypothetical protein
MYKLIRPGGHLFDCQKVLFSFDKNKKKALPHHACDVWPPGDGPIRWTGDRQAGKPADYQRDRGTAPAAWQLWAWLMNKAHVPEFVGESYRFRQCMQREAGEANEP